MGDTRTGFDDISGAKVTLDLEDFDRLRRAYRIVKDAEDNDRAEEMATAILEAFAKIRKETEPHGPLGFEQAKDLLEEEIRLQIDRLLRLDDDADDDE